MTDIAGPPPRPEDAEPQPAPTAVIPAVQDLPVSDPEVEPAENVEPGKPEAETPAVERPEKPVDAVPNGVPEKSATRRLIRVDPWSVTRMAFVMSVALMIVAVVAAAVLWILLALGGVFGSINESMGSVLADDSGSFDIKDYLGFGRMVGGALVLAAVNVVCMTALATIGAHLYNMVAAMLGGVAVTYAED